MEESESSVHESTVPTTSESFMGCCARGVDLGVASGGTLSLRPAGEGALELSWAVSRAAPGDVVALYVHARAHDTHHLRAWATDGAPRGTVTAPGLADGYYDARLLRAGASVRAADVAVAVARVGPEVPLTAVCDVPSRRVAVRVPAHCVRDPSDWLALFPAEEHSNRAHRSVSGLLARDAVSVSGKGLVIVSMDEKMEKQQNGHQGNQGNQEQENQGRQKQPPSEMVEFSLPLPRTAGEYEVRYFYAGSLSVRWGNAYSGAARVAVPACDTLAATLDAGARRCAVRWAVHSVAPGRWAWVALCDARGTRLAWAYVADHAYTARTRDEGVVTLVPLPPALAQWLDTGVPPPAARAWRLRFYNSYLAAEGPVLDVPFIPTK